MINKKNKETINQFCIKNNTPFFITIEGNIGAGKSTFLKKITEELQCQLLLEPCHEWQNINGHNLLNEFYKDIKRWAYSFQLYAFLTRIESIQKKIDNMDSNFFISERSIFADRYVFAEVCYENNNMTDLEWSMYKKWFDWTIARQNKQLLPAAIIYLQVNPEISYKRINIRGRSEEKHIPIEYLESLHNKYNELLINQKNINQFIKNIPILTINCNENFENNSEIWENMVYLIQDFMYTNFKKSYFKKGINYGNHSNSYYCNR